MLRMPAVLVIDDEPNFSHIISTKLRRAGFAVETVRDAAGALQSLLQQSSDLVLLDLRLPDADALDALPRLRAAAGNVPFLLMTAYEEEPLRARALLAGAEEVLFKPFDLDHLVQTVRRYVTLGHRFGTIHMGQAVVLQLEGTGERRETAARVTYRNGDRFAVDPERSVRPDIGDTATVQVGGEDGLYHFRTRVLAADETGSVVLAQPATIHRRQRRRYVRAPLVTEVRVRVERETEGDVAAAPDVFSAMARDVGEGGMALVALRPVPEGAPVTLAWSFPNEDPPITVAARGTVVRSETADGAGDEPVCRAAVRFQKLSPAAALRVRAHVDAARSG